MSGQIDHVRSYFAACGSGSAEDIAAHFTEDATVFDTNHAPVSGRDQIGAFWVQIRKRWDGARWLVDSTVEQGDTAAIEWSMHGIAKGEPFVSRGSEHYRFRDGLIDELRQYWTYDPAQPGSALVGFDYTAFDAPE